MKNLKDVTGNRTRDLPDCSAVSQPAALPCTRLLCTSSSINLPSTRRSFKWSLSFTFSIQDTITTRMPFVLPTLSSLSMSRMRGNVQFLTRLCGVVLN
jgi:hypothetical protein